MKLFLIFLLFGGLAFNALAQKQPTAPNDSILITIFLKHQQDKNLDSLRKIQAKNKFSEKFPPKSARVVSWYVMMGIGQVLPLKFRPRS